MNVASQATVVIQAMAGAITVPVGLARRANQVVRPRDAAEIYVNPRAELSRLVSAGAARRLATGYYALTPRHRLGDQRWRPDVESAALGIAQSDYGTSVVALMGVSAARWHGAFPRAVGVAVVAVPKQRPVMETDLGRIVFVKRQVDRLDLERAETSLTAGWVTTPEQTLLDLVGRPALGGQPEADIREAVRVLAARVDWKLVERLANEQHRPAYFRAAVELAGRAHA
jgi:hypothetical protein